MPESRRGAKTESLSLRLDPKTKFILDFVVRMRGMRVTDLVGKAIKEMADSTRLGEQREKSWVDYWHPEEGVRTLLLIMDSDVETTFDEDELREFVKLHYEFFFEDRDMTAPSTAFVQVLWDKIDEFLDHWRDHKSSDRWATGGLMLNAIKAAGMRGPTWPRQATRNSQPTPSTGRKPVNDLDEDIPF